MSINHQAINDLIDDIIDRTLISPVGPDLFYESCDRLNKAGLRIIRTNMSWGTLHPTIEALTIHWSINQKPNDIHRYLHADSGSVGWLQSPLYYCVKNKVKQVAVSLEELDCGYDFPILKDLKDLGGTDYRMYLISFSAQETGFHNKDATFISWLCDREGGFSDEEISIIERVQKHMALALKVAIRERITINTLNAYLGENAAAQVLKGSIKLGDGDTIPAVIWYSDLRNSTHLGDTLAGPELLNTLNQYFSCTAGAVIENEGEVLRFVGDAVLAIFPSEKIGMDQACKNATKAAHDALKHLKKINAARQINGKDTLDFGLGLHTGTLMFGNIGIPERLDFSVTGPAVNEAARIETMTKELGYPVLASQDFIQHAPAEWTSLGAHPLRGVGRLIDLFALKD